MSIEKKFRRPAPPKPTAEGREPTRDERIQAKVEAITKQTPERSREDIFQQAMAEVDKLLEVWGSVDVGLKWYTVEGEGKEQMEKWKGQIDEITGSMKEALESGDYKRFAEVMKFHEGDLKKVIGKVEAESQRYGAVFDDEAKQLLSIGLWLWREQGRKWAGHPAILWKMFTKDNVTLSSFLDEKGAPSCIDTSYFIKAMSDQYGIDGDVKIVNTSGVPHRYFVSESGKVMDYWWAGGTAGLKLNEQAFDDSKKKGGAVFKSICGS